MNITKAATRGQPDCARGLLPKQIIESGFRASNLRIVLGNICVCLRLEVITKIRFVLFANFFCRGFFAVLGVRCVVLDTHLTNVHFLVT